MSSRQPKIVTKLPGPKAQGLIARDHAILSTSLTRPYPLVIARGNGLWVEDVDGNQFLDMTAGIAVTATGHSHPTVVEAIKTQAEKFLHMCGADFYYHSQVELAERLAKHFPGVGPHRVFFCNSGTEAIEAAIKLARHHTGRKQLIAFYGSFHGRTCGALSLTASKRAQKERFFPLLPGVHHVPFADPRNCPVGTTQEDFARQCVDFIRGQLFTKVLPPNEVAAIVVESIQGEGGTIVPPPNFHQELQNLCREHGILYIVDEIQTGIGRTGKFFACEHFGVEPDIIAVAKGIASGLPLGAIISSAQVMSWPPGAHASTFGGNPLSCTAALATLDLVEQELMSNAKRQGKSLKAMLLDLKKRYNFIADVRGLGLMLAIEMKTHREALIERCFQKGLLLLGCGTHSIRVCPALTINEEEVFVAMQILESVCQELNS